MVTCRVDKLALDYNCTYKHLELHINEHLLRLTGFHYHYIRSIYNNYLYIIFNSYKKMLLDYYLFNHFFLNSRSIELYRNILQYASIM